MANIIKRPVRMAGASLWSGGVNTGEFPITKGGQTTFTAFSGGLITLGSGATAPISAPGTGHAVIASGPGRLNNAIPIQLISGVAAVFYDSNVAALSGVAGYTLSGYKPIGVIPANTLGSFGVFGGGPAMIEFGMPFQNGLSVSAASGTPGFTVSWTPQTPVGSGAVEEQ